MTPFTPDSGGRGTRLIIVPPELLEVPMNADERANARLLLLVIILLAAVLTGLLVSIVWVDALAAAALGVIAVAGCVVAWRRGGRYRPPRPPAKQAARRPGALHSP